MTVNKDNSRGFASMDHGRQREIASRGGHAAHDRGTAHEFTPDEARNAGRKGGESVSKDRSHMAEIGRRGGQAVSRDRSHMAIIGRRGGESVSRDRAHMAAIGREGGHSARSDATRPTNGDGGFVNSPTDGLDGGGLGRGDLDGGSHGGDQGQGAG